MAEPALHRPLAGVGRRPNWHFVVSHPAHAIALGFGSGLAPIAAGTSGTIFAWVTYDLFLAGHRDAVIALVLLASFAVGWWACTVSASHLDQTDPAAIVWDEVLAFWLVLWLAHCRHSLSTKMAPRPTTSSPITRDTCGAQSGTVTAEYRRAA